MNTPMFIISEWYLDTARYEITTGFNHCGATLEGRPDCVGQSLCFGVFFIYAAMTFSMMCICTILKFLEISPSPGKNKKSKNLNPNIDIFLKILRQKKRFYLN
jgi:hypothetical protein